MSLVTTAFEYVAATYTGQYILKKFDHFLWIVEKSALWSTDDAFKKELTAKTPTCDDVIRPLPWILFLPILLILRVFRSTVNIMAFLFVLEPLESEQIVKSVQSARQHLTQRRSQGLKSLEEHQKRGFSMVFYPVMVLDNIVMFVYLKIFSTTKMDLEKYLSHEGFPGDGVGNTCSNVEEVPEKNDKFQSTVEDSEDSDAEGSRTPKARIPKKLNNSVSHKEAQTTIQEAEADHHEAQRSSVSKSANEGPIVNGSEPQQNGVPDQNPGKKLNGNGLCPINEMDSEAAKEAPNGDVKHETAELIEHEKNANNHVSPKSEMKKSPSPGKQKTSPRNK